MVSTTIAPPTTYSEWTIVLNTLKDKVDDEAVLYAIEHGTIEWQSGVAERFSKKLIDVINFRMNAQLISFRLKWEGLMGRNVLLFVRYLHYERNWHSYQEQFVFQQFLKKIANSITS